MGKEYCILERFRQIVPRHLIQMIIEVERRGLYDRPFPPAMTQAYVCSRLASRRVQLYSSGAIYLKYPGGKKTLLRMSALEVMLVDSFVEPRTGACDSFRGASGTDGHNRGPRTIDVNFSPIAEILSLSIVQGTIYFVVPSCNMLLSSRFATTLLTGTVNVPR